MSLAMQTRSSELPMRTFEATALQEKGPSLIELWCAEWNVVHTIVTPTDAADWEYSCLRATRPLQEWDTGIVLNYTVSIVGMEVTELPEIRASDLARERFRRLIEAYERFPVSYNQMLVQGALDYCDRVLARLDEGQDNHRRVLANIRKLGAQIESLYRQYKGDASSSFTLLDLCMIEDKFELIQGNSANLNIFPRLRDVPIDQLQRA